MPPQIASIFDVLPATLLKVGYYWDDYGFKLGEKAAIVAMKAKNRGETAFIERLHKDLQGVVSDTITRDDTIDAISQHIVLAPVFEALFGQTSNPVWKAFNHVAEELDFSTELDDLEEWHQLMWYHVENITNPQAKQNVIIKVYGNFFKGFDKKQAKTIVYTPVEIVDFIIQSAQYVLESEFGTGFDGNIRVLDPFAGTGVFLARLLESGHLGTHPAEMLFGENKLLAYYTACANLETTMEKVTGISTPFMNGSYVDTFTIPPDWLELKAQGRAHVQSMIDDTLFRKARGLVDKQRDKRIIGNPPYSGGQRTANEDKKNDSHPILEPRIKNTYIRMAPKGNKRGLYNSYVKAIRWASERIGESGVIGFITPSGFITGNSEAGIRACLEMEFTDVYCFDLRGDVKKSDWRREGGKIFGSGSTVGTAITILVKNPAKHHSTIHYHGIGNYLSREEKLEIIKEHGSIAGMEWEIITPDRFHDWLEQRGDTSEQWDSITPMGSKEGKQGEIGVTFGEYSRGLATSRDPWAYNSSIDKLENNMKQHINYCNGQDLNNFVVDPKQAKKNSSMIERMKKLGRKVDFDKNKIRTVLYRPFFKQYLYFDPIFVHEPTVVSPFFPTGGSKNIAIMVADKIKGVFSTFVTGITPDLHIHEASQCFPMRVKKQKDKNRHVVGNQSTSQPVNQSTSQPVNHREPGDNSPRQNKGRILSIHNGNNTGSGSGASRAGIPHVHTVTGGDEMKDNITDYSLELYQKRYNDDSITKEDIFYYTYGILHHNGYRSKYQAFLVRGLPNIPMAPDFRAFERAGRQLANLHLNYEMCPRYDLGEPLSPIPDAPKKIAFGKKPNRTGSPGPKDKPDPSTIIIDGQKIYNNIPLINYKVNGRTPVGWFVDRYQYRENIESGITNYPLEGATGDETRAIIERLVYVGMESDNIITNLPTEFEMELEQEPTGLDKYYKAPIP